MCASFNHFLEILSETELHFLFHCRNLQGQNLELHAVRHLLSQVPSLSLWQYIISMAWVHREDLMKSSLVQVKAYPHSLMHQFVFVALFIELMIVCSQKHYLSTSSWQCYCCRNEFFFTNLIHINSHPHETSLSIMVVKAEVCY